MASSSSALRASRPSTIGPLVGTQPSAGSGYAYSIAFSAETRRVEASAYLTAVSVIAIEALPLVRTSAGGGHSDPCGCLLDQVGDLLGVGNHRDVARRDLD